MNLQKELKNLKGATYPMSYPSQADIEKVQEEKGIKDVKNTDLPNETVQNVLINCLSNYAVNDKKEVFLVQEAAMWINDEDPEKKEITERVLNFITKQVLPAMTLRETEDKDGKKVEKGLYLGWAMAQVYNELGIEKAD